jgi:2-dehydro-3-deoxyphosphooctonate aldolase (KDO 8-P synthase)
MSVRIKHITVGDGAPLVLIAGPCVVESREMVFTTAETVHKAAEKRRMPVIFKASYKKANRTSSGSFTGIGMDEALAILADVRKQFGMPVLTDIHLPDEASIAAGAVDVLQIPAFLCRQTELLIAAGETGKPVNIKKGQFLAPADMRHAAEKVTSTGNQNVLLTERGTTFGYNNLVVDMRSLSIMRKMGFPVVLDVTHSVQLPGVGVASSGGQPEFIFPIARAGIAAGCDALFVETHPNPVQALSDGSSQLPLKDLDSLLKQITAIDAALRTL